MSARPWLASRTVAGATVLAAALLVGHVPGRASAAPETFWPTVPASPIAPEILRLNDALTRLAERLKPALVQIRVRRVPDEGAEGDGGSRRRSTGSGFLVHPDGYLVTNAHVVQGVDRVEVRLSTGRRATGTVVGRDSRIDLALVKIEAPEPLPVLPLGDSNRVRVGELVLALGSPFGLEQAVSFGIVSRLGAPIGVAAPGFDFIQTDAAVNPGNSGGPLVNMAGEVVGVNTMAARTGTIGFAIPSGLVRELVPILLAKGQIEWGWLGVRIDEITEDNAAEYGLPQARGVAIQGVMPGQPAATAGLRVRDVVVSVDDEPVVAPRQLQRLIAMTPIGRTVRLGVLRDGQVRELPVVVGRYPEPGGDADEGSPAPPPIRPR